MKHLGDITKINGTDAPVVDVIIGGSPCQDLSIAGKRAGLAGERSGLYMEQIRVIKEMRQADAARGRTDELIRPRFMVWENVPGAFSSNGGKDLAAVLEEAIRVTEPEAPPISVPDKGWPTSGCLFDVDGRWSIAWRVFDAQFWGVPQRRRRIALVADFGGLAAPEVLFVRKGVSGHSEPGKPKGKEVTGDAREGSGEAVGCDLYNGALSGDRAVSLNTNANATGAGPTVMVEATGINGDRAGTLDASYYKGCGFREGKERDVVFQYLPHCRILNPNDSQGNQVTDGVNGDVYPTLRGCGGAGYQQGYILAHGVDCRNATEYPEMNGTIQSKPGGGFSLNCNQVVRVKHIVRRLTPLECERLQGFPDNWTDIGEWMDSKGKKHKAADSPRYKALGNSIALPSWVWILKRISAVYEQTPTMASLFDGIGGFPLIWERINGEGTCLWASEIEEFPMAVTQLRFGDAE